MTLLLLRLYLTQQYETWHWDRPKALSKGNISEVNWKSTILKSVVREKLLVRHGNLIKIKTNKCRKCKKNVSYFARNKTYDLWKMLPKSYLYYLEAIFITFKTYLAIVDHLYHVSNAALGVQFSLLCYDWRECVR